jgi:hypothetical protein
MSTPHPHLAARVGAGHPAVMSRRAHERLVLCAVMLVPLALALAISLETPEPDLKSVVTLIGLVLGAFAVFTLMLSSRYTVTLTLLVLYLGLLDGPIKLEAADKLASGFRNVLIAAVAAGMLMRLVVRRERITLPPLSGWVLGFVAVVLVQGLNPNTSGVLKVVGGYRQELEFVPLFFFAYVIMRNKQRFRQLFLIFGVIALANGAVGAYQSRLSPGGLASWGPGYKASVSGKGAARTFAVEGVSHPRPPALGSDAGFGGGTGVLALPGLLALLTAGRLRRRWPVLLCCAGALLGIATSASRTSTVIAVLTLLCFAALSVFAGLRVSRPLVALIVVGVLGGGVAAALLSADGNEIFHRQESLVQLAPGGEGAGDAKEKHLNEIPRDILHAPLGLGLGVSGSAGGFGGHEKVTIESEKVSGGSAYNLLAVELGAAGLFLWVGLTLNVLLVSLLGLRRIRDPELRIYLVAVLATFIAMSFQGLVGVTLAVIPAGAYVWFVPGVVAYWFRGPGRVAMAKRKSEVVARPRAVPA